jgi:hypothetical protein
MTRSCLNLFYAEPDPDRWVFFDRYPRRLLRRIIRGRPSPGGQARVFLNLCAGLDRIGVDYRINDYAHARRQPGELACIVGKPFVLDRIEWQNPILFGASVFSHPLSDPELLDRLPVAKVLVPGEWMRQMFEPYYGPAVSAWPVGIDTDLWRPSPGDARTCDVLLYDKVRWERDQYGASLINPILLELRRRGLSVATLRYGHYREDEFRELLRRCRMMIFLCEHETQGIAYQQALSCGVPVYAWDRGGAWQDPEFYPHRVTYGPVTSVPYWDDRCGMRFEDFPGFVEAFDTFQSKARLGAFSPRAFIEETLTLEQCARSYMRIVQACS